MLMNRNFVLVFFILFSVLFKAQIPNIKSSDTIADCNSEYFKNIAVDTEENHIYEDSLGKKINYVVSDQKFAEDTLYSEVKNRYSSEAFNYEEEKKVEERLNWLERLLNYIGDFLNSIFNISPSSSILGFGNIIYYLLIALAVAVLSYVIYKLVISGKSNYISKNDANINAVDYIEKNLETIDLTDYLNDAIKNKNYPLAIRFLHLSNLKLLAEKKYIIWEYTKTNLDFYNEMNQPDLKESFHNTSLVYDYIWFGNFPIDEVAFEKHQNDFLTFKKLILR